MPLPSLPAHWKQQARPAASQVPQPPSLDGGFGAAPPRFPAFRAPVHQQFVQPPLHEQRPPIPAPLHEVLPTFTPARPASWFSRCEDAFRMKGVVDQHDMFALAFEKLDDAAQLQVDDLAEMRPRPRDAYEQLRHRVIASHALSEDA